MRKSKAALAADRDEAMVELGYMAGFDHLMFHYAHDGGSDSRCTMEVLIGWANEFSNNHEHTDWNDLDYMIEIEKFYVVKKAEVLKDGNWSISTSVV